MITKYNHVMEMHKLANEERIFQKEMEKVPPPAKRAKFGTKAMPIDPLAEFIDLSVWTYAHEGFWCGTVYVCTRRHVRL